MSVFCLRILACNRPFYEGPCRSITVQATDGLLTVMPHHEDAFIATAIGQIRYQLEDGTWETAVAGPGVMDVYSNHVTLLVHTIERPEEIDENRATEAVRREREKLAQITSRKEYLHTQAALTRALVRLSARK